MFIRKTKNKIGVNYFHLVESYRNDQGKNRQRILLSLGNEFDHKLHELANSLSKFIDTPSLKKIEENMSIDKTYVLGPLLLIRKLFDHLGITKTLDNISKQHPKIGFNLTEIIFTMVVCRFISPCSKLKIHDFWLDQLYPHLIHSDFKLHQFYRSLDIVYQNKDFIESRLLEVRKKKLKLPIDIVLYDLTTLRFESTNNETGELRRFGYSKEMRSDCTQVVLGLLLDCDGLPIGVEVFPGNTFEGSTLSTMVTKLKEKFSIRRFIFVGDRALFSDKNFKEIESSDSEYVIGMKLALFKKREDDFYNLSNFTYESEDWAVYETTHNEKRCIITWSKERATRDRNVRNDIINKIEKKLHGKKVTARSFVSNSNYQKFISGINEGRPQLNQEAIAKESLKDGFFGIITNVNEKSTQELFAIYKSLWIIEDAFGELKGFFKTRPMYHWTDSRIVGHVMICFLSYLCESFVTKKLREEKVCYTSKSTASKIIKERPLSAAMALNDLKNFCAIPVTVGERKIWLSTEANDTTKKIFDLLKIKQPNKILKIEESTDVVNTKK